MLMKKMSISLTSENTDNKVITRARTKKKKKSTEIMQEHATKNQDWRGGRHN